jgi:hypothetical protein
MKTMTVVTVAIWLTGVSSAAALANVLTKPPTPVVKAEAPALPAVEVPPNLDHFKIPTPNVEPVRVRSQIGFVRAKKTEKRCSDWKPMQLGPIDRGVRYCE